MSTRDSSHSVLVPVQMKQTVLPSKVSGYSVTGPSLVSLGHHEKHLAFTVSPSLLAVTECSGKLDCLMSDSSTVFCMVEDPAAEVISVVRVHDEKDLLCVGTEGHGAYLTSATSPLLSSETRLPLPFIGEQIWSACFLSVAASLVSDTKVSTLYGKSEDLLVLSSAFKRHHEPSPHRLSLWQVREGCLLWRGPMEPISAMCAFPRVPSFAGCSRGALSLFTVRRAEGAGADPAVAGSAPLPKDVQPCRKSAGGVALLMRVCDTVEVLKGVEYVHCASCNNPKEGSFLGLTATGFLVSFDRFTGAIIRWMDCKISPACSVTFASRGNYILLAGTFARFFLSKNWGFCGRVKVESTAVSSPQKGLHFTAGVSIGSCAVLFSSNNGYSIQHFVQSSTAPTTPASGVTISANAASPATGELATSGNQYQGHKLRFHQKSFFCPVEADEFEGKDSMQWIRPTPSPSPHGTWCLWTRKCLRLYSPKLFLRKQVVVNSSCVVYHTLSRVVLIYELDSAELVAYAGVDEWRLATSLRQTERLDSLCAGISTDVCAGYCLDNHTVYAFSSRWKSSPNNGLSTLNLVPLWIRRLEVASGSLNRIFFLGSRLYGKADNTLVELEIGRLHAFDAPMLSLCVAGTDVLFLQTDRCMHYAPDSGFLKPLHCSLSSPPTCVTYETTFGLVAVADTHRVYVMCLGDASPFWEVRHSLGSRHPEAEVIRSVALRADPMHVVLSILNAQGSLSEYVLKTDELPHSARCHTFQTVPRSSRSDNLPPMRNGKKHAAVSAQGARNRALSEGTPTNLELRDRFDALSGFFAEHKKMSAASGRSRSQMLRCGTLSSFPFQPRNAEPLAPSGKSRIAHEPAIETPKHSVDGLVPESKLPGSDQEKTILSLESGAMPDVDLPSARFGATPNNTPTKTPTRLSNNNVVESAASMSAMLDVSALTFPAGSCEMKGNDVLNTGLDESGFADDGLRQRSLSNPSRNTANAQANFHLAQLNTIASPECKINNSFTDFTNSCSRPAAHDAAVQPQPNHPRTTSGSLSFASTGRLSEHTRQLRESLEHLKDLLDQPDLRFDAEDDAEFSKLPFLLSNIATTVQSCRDRRSNDTSSSSLLHTIDNALPKDYSQVLLTQMQLIQQQYKHLEQQNQIILEKLSGGSGK